MKFKLLIIILLVASNFFSQSKTLTDSINDTIERHFEIHKAELYRYGGLTMYGETKFSFSQDQIELELNLLKQTKSTDLINRPTKVVFALCHNLLIHSPEEGEELLYLLNKPTDDPEIIDQLFLEVLFSGSFGEQLALNNLFIINEKWKKVWSSYLKTNAIYDSSIAKIKSAFEGTDNVISDLI